MRLPFWTVPLSLISVVKIYRLNIADYYQTTRTWSTLVAKANKIIASRLKVKTFNSLLNFEAFNTGGFDCVEVKYSTLHELDFVCSKAVVSHDIKYISQKTFKMSFDSILIT